METKATCKAREGNVRFVKKVMEKVFSKSFEILFIQYFFSIELNGEKTNEDKLKISVFRLLHFSLPIICRKWIGHGTKPCRLCWEVSDGLMLCLPAMPLARAGSVRTPGKKFQKVRSQRQNWLVS